MSLAEACIWSLIRAIVIAVACLPIAVCLERILRNSKKRRVWLAALLVPFLMPELLIGFVYSETTLRLVKEIADPNVTFVPPTQLRLPQTMDRPLNLADVLAEALYAALLLARFVPVATLIMWLMPAPRLSAEAVYCQRLLLEREPRWPKRVYGSIDCFVRGPLMGALPAFAIVFLLVFQEFEIASLMQISRAPVAWTVWLFDNHAGGLMLSLSLKYSVGPVVCESIVVGLVCALLLRGDWEESASVRRNAGDGTSRFFAIFFASIAIGLTTVIPFVRLSNGVLVGLRGLLGQPTMLGNFASELGVGFVFGLAAALTAYWLTGLMLASRAKLRLTVGISSLGLVGSLVLSLVALSLFQQPVMNSVYDTPVPMLLVLTLYLLPRAVLLRLVFFARQPREPVFAADLLRSSRSDLLVRSARDLLWVLRSRPAFWVVALLTYWGYWDLTVASILRPTNLTPFTPGLYNLMHYGRNETLSAMTLLAGGAPIVMLVIGLVSQRGFRRLVIARAS